MPGALVGPFGRYELGTEVVTVGRSSSNTLIINDGQVSSRHLQILPQAAGYVLIDVGSSNGTMFNGRRLPPQTPQPLRHGDTIIIGSTRLIVEIAAGAFPGAPRPAAPQGEIIFGPPEQYPAAGLMDDGAPPGYPPPPQAAPRYGPPPQAVPPYGAPGAPNMPNYGAPPPGGPFIPARQAPDAFGAYPGNAPGPAYYPGPPGAGEPPPGFGGAPGVGVGAPPAGARRTGKRTFLLIGGLLVIAVIVGSTVLALFLLNRPKPQPVVSTPNAATQVVMPFYTDLEKQDYMSAAKFFSSDFLQLHGGLTGTVALLQNTDKVLGTVTKYQIISVKPASGSSTNETANVQVTRMPPNSATPGTFHPDTLKLTLQTKTNTWQINDWMPGQRQT